MIWRVIRSPVDRFGVTDFSTLEAARALIPDSRLPYDRMLAQALCRTGSALQLE